MYKNQENRELWEALDQYFLQNDMDAARQAIARWHSFASVGPLWIVDHLEKMTPEIEGMVKIGVPNPEIAIKIVIETKMRLEQARDLANLKRKKAGRIMFMGMATCLGKEDEMSLIACVLNDGLLSTIEPKERGILRTVVKHRYDGLAGTGCRLAVAELLNQLGDSKPLDNLRNAGYLSIPGLGIVEMLGMEIATRGAVVGPLLENYHLGWIPNRG